MQGIVEVAFLSVVVVVVVIIIVVVVIVVIIVVVKMWNVARMEKPLAITATNHISRCVYAFFVHLTAGKLHNLIFWLEKLRFHGRLFVFPFW